MSAANEVCNEYTRTLIRVKAKQVVRRHGFGRSEQEDVEQDLMVHLLAQVDQFDPARSSIKTFVARVVDSGVAMLVRDRERFKRSPENGVEVESLAAHVDQGDGLPTRLASLISQDDLERRTGPKTITDTEAYELAESVAAANAKMPSELQAICQSLMLRNRTATERDLNLSRRQFEAAIVEIRKRYTQAGLKKS